MILAGGKGVRLRPFTATFPKPLVPLGETPVIEVLMKRLITFEITETAAVERLGGSSCGDYAVGSNGPRCADEFLARDGRAWVAGSTH